MAPLRSSIGLWASLLVLFSIRFYPRLRPQRPSILGSSISKASNASNSSTQYPDTRGGGLGSLVMVNGHGKNNDSVIVDGRDGEEQKKLFVLHVGPHKTATTMIQHESHKLENTTLLEDDFHYVWRFSYKTSLFYRAMKDFQCRKEVVQAVREKNDDGTPFMPDCWDNMRSGLQQLCDKNIFLSSEDLSSASNGSPTEWWDALRDLVEDEFGYHMVIIVGYRRLFEWLPSAQAQTSRGGVSNTRWNLWFKDGASVPNPIYPRVLQNEYINPQNSTKTYAYRWTPSYLEAVPTNIEVRLFNLHGNSHHSLLTNFFCDVVPRTPSTCQYCLDREEDPDRELGTYNPSTPFWYDEIVIAAEKAGMINTTIHKRRKVWKAAWKHNRDQLNRNDIDHFPWICPTPEEFETILNASLNWERELIPGSIDNSPVLEEHETKFWEYAIVKKKFCKIDADRTVQQDEWKSFFQNYF